MSQTVKRFFVEPTLGQIKSYSSVKEFSRGMIKKILDLNNDEAGIINKSLVPKNYDGPRRFMKSRDHEIRLQRLPGAISNLEKRVQNEYKPINLRRKRFSRVGKGFYNGFAFQPSHGTDQRDRKVSLVELLKGAKIYGYVNQSGNTTSIDVHPYDDVKAIRYQGAEIVVKVPSRMKHQPKYEIKFVSVPVVAGKNRYAIGTQIATDHNCEKKRFNIRYSDFSDKQGQHHFKFCSHDIAGYFGIVDFYINERNNKVPLEMSPFPIPTETLMNFYDKLTHNVLIRPEKGTLPRKLNEAEKEILMWRLVRSIGHDDTLYSNTKLRDYQWRQVK